eukprot:s3508_g15.t1
MGCEGAQAQQHGLCRGVHAAIMNFAEQRPLEQEGQNADHDQNRQVVTDIFVAWGHQQEKDSPLTVEDIAERFDQLYQEALASPAVEVPPASIPGAAGKAEAAAPPPPPASAAGPAGSEYLAQQAAAMAYHQQFAQQLMQMYGNQNQGAPWGKGKAAA